MINAVIPSVIVVRKCFNRKVTTCKSHFNYPGLPSKPQRLTVPNRRPALTMLAIGTFLSTHGPLRNATPKNVEEPELTRSLVGLQKERTFTNLEGMLRCRRWPKVCMFLFASKPSKRQRSGLKSRLMMHAGINLLPL